MTFSKIKTSWLITAHLASTLPCCIRWAGGLGYNCFWRHVFVQQMCLPCDYLLYRVRTKVWCAPIALPTEMDSYVRETYAESRYRVWWFSQLFFFVAAELRTLLSSTPSEMCCRSSWSTRPLQNTDHHNGQLTFWTPFCCLHKLHRNCSAYLQSFTMGIVQRFIWLQDLSVTLPKSYASWFTDSKYFTSEAEVSVTSDPVPLDAAWIEQLKSTFALFE